MASTAVQLCTRALIALGAHCGDASAAQTVAGDLGARGRSPCAGTTLAGRDDLRKHFALSAAFEAAGGRAVSFGFGEIKELVDAGREHGSGFSFDDFDADGDQDLLMPSVLETDPFVYRTVLLRNDGADGAGGIVFTDIAADLAGIRFAEAAAATPPGGLGSLAGQLDGEAAYFPRVDDLPSRLTEAQFAARYDNADSAAYATEIARIESRIGALPIHADTGATATTD